jgi:hypothetical protein
LGCRYVILTFTIQCPLFIRCSGNPGCGKNILAYSSIEELKASGFVAYFFFKMVENRGNSAVDAYRALLAQILSS